MRVSKIYLYLFLHLWYRGDSDEELSETAKCFRAILSETAKCLVCQSPSLAT